MQLRFGRRKAWTLDEAVLRDAMKDGSEQTEGALTDGSTGVLRLEIAHGRAWLMLVGILAIHVADEALTGFLDFYNPLVLSIRERIPWLPMPAFRFDVWLTGLIIAVVILALLTRAVRRGAGGTVLLSIVFSFLMFGNGLGHLLGSVYFGRWLPGTTSAPLLLAGSVHLVWATLSRRRWSGS